MNRHPRPALVLAMLIGVLAATTANPPAVWAKDSTQDDVPQRVRERSAKELLRGEWVGISINQDQKEKDCRITLESGDFSKITGRFNNWKITGAKAQLSRRGKAQIVLYAPGKTDGKSVDKPITCVGQFDDTYSRWAGSFQGFTQSGTFELTRQTPAPQPADLRGQWVGSLTSQSKKNAKDAEATPPVFSFNLLTGDFAAITGIVFHTADHPAAEQVSVTYYDPETRQLDLRVEFAKPPRGVRGTAKAAVFQGVFDSRFSVFEGAYQTEGKRESGRFKVEKREN